MEECYRFFDDLCTINEIQSLSQRLEVARMLSDGNTYHKIEAETGASTATISRVKRCLQLWQRYIRNGFRANQGLKSKNNCHSYCGFLPVEAHKILVKRRAAEIHSAVFFIACILVSGASANRVSDNGKPGIFWIRMISCGGMMWVNALPQDVAILAVLPQRRLGISTFIMYNMTEKECRMEDYEYMYDIREWRHAFKLDPDKVISDEI